MIVGIDTKTRAYHVAWGDGDFEWFHSAQEDQDLARVELYWHAKRMFEQGRPSDVFCEAPLALQNGATTRLLCMAAAAVWCAFVASETDGTWFWVDPATWKKHALGGAPPRGTKHKPWIRQRSLELWPTLEGQLELLDTEPDLFDAWCLMQYGRQVLDSL